jgi:two-component system, cell cycle sensor histidine kinase and response regulator CckA
MTEIGEETSMLFQTVLDNGPIVLWAVNASGVLTVAHGRGLAEPALAARHVVGRSALELHRTITFLDAGGHETDGTAAVARAIAGETVSGVSLVEGTYLENVLIPLRASSGEIRGAVGVSLVVSERTRLEEQLRQSQKMEAIGQLAAGIAHDFNNILTAITGYAGLLLEELHEEDPRRADVKEIQNAGVRGAGLTRQLLAFSRKQVLEPRVVHLGNIVENLLPMLRRVIGEHIVLTTELTADPWAVYADPGQLEQVLLNLVVNSRDAMTDGGEITIITSNVEVTEPYRHEKVVLPAGRYAMLAVRDTGRGMTPEVRARVFEPFFTTKPQGKGTGLGLSTVYGIVKQSGGYVWVTSEPGRGATFTTYLPRVETAPAPSRADAVPLASLRGSETILVVEDQEAVRTLTRRVLEGYGYRVLAAADGIEAFRVAEAHAEPIHLLVTDVIMPEMSGREVSLLLTATHPEMKTLYISGYPDESIVHHDVLAPGVAFLQKPFAPEVLAKRVRAELDRHDTGADPAPRA